MTGRASWVLSPTDGKTHLLTGESLGQVLATRCGQPVPSGVLPHDRLPSRQLCRECFADHLLPAHPVFARRTPAGRRFSDAPEPAPGGQPVPPEGHGRAACGRLIPAAGLTIQSPPAESCAGCLTVGTAR